MTLLYNSYLLTSCHAINSLNCESVKGAFFRIVGFAGKRFPFSPPPPPSPPIFMPPKSEKCFEGAEKPTEMLAKVSAACVISYKWMQVFSWNYHVLRSKL